MRSFAWRLVLRSRSQRCPARCPASKWPRPIAARRCRPTKGSARIIARSRTPRRNAALPASSVSPLSSRPSRLSFTRPPARRPSPLTFLRGICCPIVLRFRRRAPDRSAIASARFASAGREQNGTQRRTRMKYLLMIVAALALVGTASATSRSADCCNGGGGCCLIKLGCCAK